MAEEEPPSPSNGSTTIWTSVSIYFPIFIIGWCLFEYVRRKYPNTYNTRDHKEDTKTEAGKNDLNTGAFKWIMTLFKVPDDEIFEFCGLDSLCFLRFLRLGLKISLCVIALSVVLFPVYATGTHEEEKIRNIDGYERITMGNLHKGDPRLVACIIGAYVVTFYVLYLLLEEYQVYITRRHQFLQQEDVQQYTVQIDYLPMHLRTKNTLSSYMKRLFPGHVHEVNVALECATVEKDVAERLKVKDNLEAALKKFARSGSRPEVKQGSTCCCGGEKVDAINFYEKRLDDLNNSIAERIRSIQEQEQAIAMTVQESDEDSQFVSSSAKSKGSGSNENERYNILKDDDNNASQKAIMGAEQTDLTIMRSSAFVSFNSIQACQMAKQLLQSEKVDEMHVCSVPDPRMGDMIWENVGISLHQRNVWILISTVITFAIVIFWSIPTAFVAGLASVDKLKERLTFLESAIDSAPWLEEVLKQLAPIVLIVMAALAPIIFGILAKKEGYSSLLNVRGSLFSKLAYYHIVQIFFVTAISGVIWSSISDIIDQPTSAISILGSTIPTQSVFFITYIIVKTAIGLLIDALRVVPVVFAWIHAKLVPEDEPEKKDKPIIIFKPITMPGCLDVTAKLADFFLLFLLVLVFSIIAPLLAYFGAMFFFFAEVVYRRQMLCVHDPSTQSSGVYWPHLFGFIVGGLLISQLTLVGVIGIKESPIGAVIVAVLPVVTLLFSSYVKSLYPRTGESLPLTICERIDQARNGNDFNFLNNVFTQPAMLESTPIHPDQPREVVSPSNAV